MNDETADAKLIDETRLGTIWSEHRDPKRPHRYDDYITVERAAWTDRTFYTLACRRGLHAEYCDLNRDGWQQLRALCDAVIAEMDAAEQEARDGDE